MKDEEIWEKLSRGMRQVSALVPADFADKVMANIEAKRTLRQAWREWLDDLWSLKWEALAGGAAFAALLIYVFMPHSLSNGSGKAAAEPNLMAQGSLSREDAAQVLFEDEDNVLEGVSDE